MSISSIFLLAAKNIKKHLRHHLHFFAGVFLSVFFVMTSFIFLSFISFHINEGYPENKQCYIKYYDDDNKINIRGACNDASSIDGVSYALKLSEAIALRSKTEEHRFPLDFTFENQTLDIDGVVYGYTGGAGVLNEHEVISGLTLSQIDTAVSDFSAFLERFYDEPFICGSGIKYMDDILVPEQYLTIYGITPDMYSSLIGKSLCIKLNTPKNYIITSKYTIRGIIRNECFTDIPISMIIPLDNSYVSYLDIGYVFLDSYHSEKFDKTKRELDSLFGINGITCQDYENIVFLDRQASFTKHVLMIVVASIAFSVIFHLSVYIFFTIEQNKKYNFLLFSLGMTSKRIALLSFFEISLNTAAASVIGVILSYVVSFCADSIINSDIAIVTWRWDIFMGLILTAVPLITVLLSLVIALYTFRSVSIAFGDRSK